MVGLFGLFVYEFLVVFLHCGIFIINSRLVGIKLGTSISLLKLALYFNDFSRDFDY